MNEIVERLLDVAAGLRIIAWRKECKADKLELFVSILRWAWSEFIGPGTKVRKWYRTKLWNRRRFNWMSAMALVLKLRWERALELWWSSRASFSVLKQKISAPLSCLRVVWCCRTVDGGEKGVDSEFSNFWHWNTCKNLKH
jgi:hypothetical protein